MKFKNIFGAIAICSIIASCSSDDSTTENLEGQSGPITLKFDNGVGDQDFIFNSNYNKSDGESFKLETLKYIISNVRFTDNNGNTFTPPSNENIFIVDEANGNNAGEIFVSFNDVQAADYTQVTFGLGVDQDRFAQGAAGQGDFLQQAQDAGMFWTWASGYKFMRLDGTFTSGARVNEALNIHMGSVGTSLDNYREVTLDLTNTARVREGSNPEIHLKVDIMKILEGTTTVSFADGYDQVHTDATETPIIADNFMQSFSVDHVHND